MRSERAAAETAPGAIARLITRYGLFVAQPIAFLVVALYGVFWFLFEPRTFDWHAVATLVIWLMTLLIQRVAHRDTQAIQAKLDELLHAVGEASNELTRIDEREPEEIEKHREQARLDD